MVRLKVLEHRKVDHIFGYPDHYVQSVERHPMDYLASLLRDWGWQDKKLGVEMDNYYFSAAAYIALQKALPAAPLADTTGLVNWQRAIKSPQEITYMKMLRSIWRGPKRKLFRDLCLGLLN